MALITWTWVVVRQARVCTDCENSSMRGMFGSKRREKPGLCDKDDMSGQCAMTNDEQLLWHLDQKNEAHGKLELDMNLHPH